MPRSQDQPQPAFPATSSLAQMTGVTGSLAQMTGVTGSLAQMTGSPSPLVSMSNLAAMYHQVRKYDNSSTRRREGGGDTAMNKSFIQGNSRKGVGRCRLSC